MADEKLTRPSAGQKTSTLSRGVAALEQLAIGLAGGLVAILGVLIVVSTAMRNLIDTAVPDDAIISGLLMIAVTALPWAYAQATRRHIAVSVLTDLFPDRVQKVCILVGDIVSLLFFGGLTIAAVAYVPTTFGADYAAILYIPVWPMRALFAAALILFVCRLLLSVVEGIRDLSNP